MGYSKHAIKGITWIGLLRIFTRGITFVRLAILARILTPTQFGVFGIATLILSFLEIITETGVNVFLVQEKGDINKYINSAWLTSIIRGSIIGLLLVLLAKPIAVFFNSIDSYPLILLISAVPFIRGFINPSIVYIQKNVEFHKEFYLRSTLFFIDSIIVISSALVFKSAISFVYGLLASALAEVVLSFIFFKPYPTISFEIAKVKHIIKKGWWVTVTGMFSYVTDNGDNAVVGKLLGTNSLGIYQVAYKLSTLPITEITNTINTVVFPVYSKFSEEKERLHKAFVKVSILSSITALILGIIIFIFSNEIVLVVAGSKWVGAVPVIKILAIYGVLRTIFGNFAPLALSIKRQDLIAKTTLLRMLGLIITIIPLTVHYGLVGTAYSVLISIIVEIPVISYYLLKFYKSN